MADNTPQLPPVTIVIEWENAIDVADEWTRKAMLALQDELGRVRFVEKPRILYLFDETKVAAGTVETVLEAVAPRMRELADVEIVPTPGLTYYKLKNFGVSRSRTGITVMLDSDAAPQPGWLEHLLEPFADPETMAVGGFTVLGTTDFLSRTMALSWVFNLPHQKEKTKRRSKIHVNNCAVRTDFFRSHPFPDLPAFKKQCVFWLRGVLAEGHKYVRTADATAIHAPHPGPRFLAWRAWTGGMDSDFLGFQTGSRSRAGRLGYAFRYFGRKTLRAWRNIVRHGGKVGLPTWQYPAAMIVSLAYYLVTLAGQLYSVFTKDWEPLPALYTGQPQGAA